MPKFINKKVIKERLDCELYQKYLSGELNQHQLSEELSISTDVLRDIFHEHGYLTKHDYNQSQINHNFFNCIETEEQAYILGFYLADGYLDEKHNRITFSVTESDRKIIENIQRLIAPTQKILTVKPRANSQGYTSKPMVSIQIPSKQLANDLQKYGIGGRKTYNENIDVSFIPKDLMIHFIRGYFDGDGTVYSKEVVRVRNGRQISSENCNWSILSHNSHHLHQIQKFLSEECGIYSNIIKDGRGNFLISITRKTDFMKMRELLYKDATLYLDRKKEKYESVSFTKTPLNRKVKLTMVDNVLEFNSLKECGNYLNVTSTSIRNWIKNPEKSKYMIEYI